MEHFIEIRLPVVRIVSENFKSDSFDIVSIGGPFIAFLILVSCFCRHEGFAATSHRLCVSALICLHQSTIGNLITSDLIRLHLSSRQLGHPFNFMTGLLAFHASSNSHITSHSASCWACKDIIDQLSLVWSFFNARDFVVRKAALARASDRSVPRLF